VVNGLFGGSEVNIELVDGFHCEMGGHMGPFVEDVEIIQDLFSSGH